MLMPGYHKDIYGWLAHPGTEAYNKLGGFWQTLIEEARGRETPALGSHPFIRPNASFLQNVTDRMAYLFSKLDQSASRISCAARKVHRFPHRCGLSVFMRPARTSVIPRREKLLQVRSTSGSMNKGNSGSSDSAMLKVVRS
jgi:hypothetical protein